MTEVLSVLAGLIAVGGYVPYARDILAGRVRPSRSARIMFVLLLTLTTLLQHDIGSGWLLAFNVGEWIGSIGILLLAVRRGVGGWSKIDFVCYALLVISLIFWQTTGNALIALHLSIIADVIAFTPTIAKTWRQPWTETPLFFITGVVAPLLNILAVGKYSYALLAFPLYIALANLIEVILIIYRQRVVPPTPGSVSIDHQPLN
jgi:hypothetical protein